MIISFAVRIVIRHAHFTHVLWVSVLLQLHFSLTDRWSDAVLSFSPRWPISVSECSARIFLILRYILLTLLIDWTTDITLTELVQMCQFLNGGRCAIFIFIWMFSKGGIEFVVLFFCCFHFFFSNILIYYLGWLHMYALFVFFLMFGVCKAMGTSELTLFILSAYPLMRMTFSTHECKPNF